MMLQVSPIRAVENRRRVYLERLAVERERGKQREPRVSDIVAEVVKKSGVSEREMRSQRRARHIVLARHEVIYRAVEETGLSFTTIGRAVNHDHTTVIYGHRCHAERIAKGEA